MSLKGYYVLPLFSPQLTQFPGVLMKYLCHALVKIPQADSNIPISTMKLQLLQNKWF